MRSLFKLKYVNVSILAYFTQKTLFCVTDEFQYPANNPIEDRISVGSGSKYKIYSVFDGHGGWQVSDYLMKNLNDYFDLNFKQENDPIKSLQKTYDDLESNFHKFASHCNSWGIDVSRIGSCSLSALLSENKLYVANCGDSKGVLVSDDGKQIDVVKVNKKLNAGSKKEQRRLREQFKGEDDIVKCKREKVCYVKGRLQPTRAFGDLRLKDPLFNKNRIENFTGPYITHEPEIRVFDITPNQKYLILGSDGLWDQIKEKDVKEVMQKLDKNLDTKVLRQGFMRGKKGEKKEKIKGKQGENKVNESNGVIGKL